MEHTLRLLLACLLLVLFSAGLAWGATVGPRFEGEKIVEVSSHLVHDTDDHEHTAGVSRSDDGRRRAGHRLVIRRSTTSNSRCVRHKAPTRWACTCFDL